MSFKLLSSLSALLVLGVFVPMTSSAQGVSAYVEGTVLDPADAAIPNASVQLKDKATGASRQVSADERGFFRVLALPAGTYTLTASANGFKTQTINDIVLAISEMRYLKVNLAIGSASDSISVTADATPIQTASSEKAALVDAEQLESVTLKGRDPFGYMNLLPGVIDTANRDVTSPNGLSNITINGNGSRL